MGRVAEENEHKIASVEIHPAQFLDFGICRGLWRIVCRPRCHLAPFSPSILDLHTRYDFSDHAWQFLFHALREPLGFYGWFTEDFDTADLKEAKAPLDELG